MSKQLSNKILWGQPFKRQDLSGANFQRSDIRLCNFSYANLEKTDFSGVITGQFYPASLFMGVIFGVIIFVLGYFSSPRNYSSLILNSLSATALGFTLSVLSVGKDSLRDFWHHTKFFINLMTGLFIVWFIFTSLPTAFSKGDIAIGIFLITLIWLAYILLRRSFNTLVNATGTDFTGARLANANFTGALLRNCDFTKATLDHVNWANASFKRCKFSDDINLKNPKVRNLCTSRRSEIEKDFSFTDLSDLNLVEIDLRGANLNAAILNGANLRNADLREVNLSNALAIRTDFTGVNLSGACIANWAITPETNFTDVICSHFFTDLTKKERKPTIGTFEKGDFAKFIFGSKDYEVIRQELEDSQLQRSKLQQELDQIRSSSQNNPESFKLEKQIFELNKQIPDLIEKLKEYPKTVINCKNYNHIEQHGEGDNIAGDKVEGNKIG